MNSRKELKFLCDDRTLIQIENRIKGIMKRDRHQMGESYNIRSVYFDSPSDACLNDNQAGIGTRSKYRFRIYDCDDTIIKAEIKSKCYDTTHKESAAISRQQFEACMRAGSIHDIAGHYLHNKDTDKYDSTGQDKARDVILRMVQKITAEGYRPAAIVEYERCAYTYMPCNVRVTFDRNIAVSRKWEMFFDRDMPVVPACETGIHMLEVKYDEFLPDYILTLLKAGDMRRTSFSKYYMARMAMPV
ncbi:MAG: polyphosphate polymerase domain-containing protein [Lachnospiraceae bacterium]|nr:polyphosphate polymerase domain-containing protein [Lachnospiraceae bacterium]